MAPRERNLDPFSAAMAMVAERQPRLKCTATTREEWRAWRTAFDSALRHNLGKLPAPVPLNPVASVRVRGVSPWWLQWMDG